MAVLSKLSTVHFIADLAQDPIKYAKSRGHFPRTCEAIIQKLALFNLIAIADSLSSALKNTTSLARDIRFSDLRSIVSSSLQIVSSTFNAIRYAEVFEEAIKNGPFLLIPKVGFLGRYILISKISLGLVEIYESYLFLHQLDDAKKDKLIQAAIEEQTSDYSKERAFARNTSENVLNQVETYNDRETSNDRLIEVLQKSAEKALIKKVVQLAVNCIRFVALFFLQNVAHINTLLFICKLSKPVVDHYYTEPLKTISFSTQK